MTDLDSTQILNADESLIQNTSVVETVNHLKITFFLFRRIPIDLSFQEAAFKILSGFEPKTFHIKRLWSNKFVYFEDIDRFFSFLEETIIGRAAPSDLVIAAPVNKLIEIRQIFRTKLLVSFKTTRQNND